MKASNNIMLKISAFIVDKRRAFYFLFAAALVLSIISIPKVRVNNDISSYLPPETETRRGLDIMEEEFTTYDTAKVMVANVTAGQAERLKGRLEQLGGVKSVEFDEEKEHYQKSSALFEVTLEENDDLDAQLAVLDDIKNTFAEYDCYVYSDTVDDSSKKLEQEMNLILLLALLVIVGVLLFTSESYMEVLVFLMVFGAAALLNMGTNYLLGEISFITKSVAVVLQLALAIDYSIILSHRFAEEKKDKNAHDAIVAALSKAIIEISSSSLTTIAGLAALMIMKLRIGMDMGLVLCKGIIFSLVVVFLLMPGLLLMFSKWIDKSTHKSFVPSIKGWCRMVVRTRYFVPVVFAVVMAAAIYLSAQCGYSFDANSEQAKKATEKSVAMNKINDIFGTEHTLAVIVPKGDYDKEARVLELVEANPHITSALGLANTKIDDDYTLTQRINAKQFSELAGVDYDLSRLLFQAYGASNQQYGALFNSVNDYQVPIIDIFMFIHEQMDLGVINLSSQQTADINELYDTLSDARAQLEGENYTRMVFTYSTDVESDETYQMLDDIRASAQKYYPEPLLASDSTNSRDLRDSFSEDNNKVNLITILAVLFILMATFKSSGIPVLLVLTIQGSIWMNFSFPAVSSSSMYFLSYLVVSSIQMGATIDYAIVFTNRYLTLRQTEDHKDAAIDALNQSFPTILTSGSIMTVAGFLIGGISTNAIISSLGTALGRGTLISIILVMLVLPQLFLLGDRLIEKTSFASAQAPEKKRTDRTGVTYVNGRIRGYVNGYVDGALHGFIRGSVSAQVDVDGEPQKELPPGKQNAERRARPPEEAGRRPAAGLMKKPKGELAQIPEKEETDHA